MSLDFDQVGDVVSLANVVIGSAYSGCALINADDQGENDRGCLMEHGPDTAERFEFRWNGSVGSKKLRLLVEWSTGQGAWDMTTGFAATAGVKWVGFTYNGGATTNDPTLYTFVGTQFSILTVGSGLTEISAPTGALSADNQTFRVGGSPAGDQDWDGRIGEVALWTRLLTDNEMAAVAHLGVLAIPGAHLYWPMDNRNGVAHALDYSGNGRHGTISGAVVGANPPIRPCGRRG